MQDITRISKDIDRLDNQRKKMIEIKFMQKNDDIIKLKRELQSAKDEINSLKAQNQALTTKLKQI